MTAQIRRVLLFGIALTAVVIYFAYRFNNETTTTPCSPGGEILSCYSVTPRMCDSTWNRSVDACKEFIQKFSLPPGRLTGPIMEKCQQAIVDNAFSGSRRSTDDCKAMFRDLESWKQRNDFR